MVQIRKALYVGVLAFTVALAPRCFAQQAPESGPAAGLEQSGGGWEPLGEIPVDQAGAGRRGYTLTGEAADVVLPGRDEITLHSVASNNFYREQTANFLVSQRYETHTAAIGYRRGFKAGKFPRFELGGQIQLHESDSGVLNGFISGFENFWVSITGSTSAKNQLRDSGAAAPPLGTVIVRDGRSLYRTDGEGSGIGDVYFVAKAMLIDRPTTSGGAQLSARIAVNLSGKSQFTEGNYTGLGISLDKKVVNWLTLHGDVRATLLLDRVSIWGLPLKQTSVGFSIGPELKITRNNSFSVQFDGSSTPYLPTGALAFDQNYGDISFGLAHRFKAGRRHLITQLYGRENMNLPFQVRWNTDPDFAAGLKVTLR
jgi:hypothetical protein